MALKTQFRLTDLKPCVMLPVVFLILSCTAQRQKVAPSVAQNPSPMQEHIRVHDRLTDTLPKESKIIVEDVLSKPVTLYLPPKSQKIGTIDLIVHFHGAPFIPIKGVYGLDKPIILAVVNQGSGSSVYAKPFKDPKTFDLLVTTIETKLAIKKIDRIFCSAFSAGYGAVRELICSHFDKIDGILLLDGLHTDYIPKATPLAQGGQLNTEELGSFLRYAKSAVKSEKKMILTHSEIFPGTFSSTTETSDWLIQQLGLKRTPVLKWGPMGMQQIAETRKGHFWVKGFAGNSAPDHIDHFHGMPLFLKCLLTD